VCGQNQGIVFFASYKNLMKKIFTLLLIHLSFFSFAQVSVGVKGGLNLSRLATENDASAGFLEEENIKTFVGFHAGMYLQVPLADKLSLIPELQFTKRGFVYDDGRPRTRTNLNYLELPVLVSYSPIEWLGIDLGPTAAYFVSAKIKSDGHSAGNADPDNKFDLSISGGVRVRINQKISVLGRYNYGLTTVYEISFRGINNEDLGSAKTYHRNIQFGMSYKLK
jgi:hypothetical protein